MSSLIRGQRLKAHIYQKSQLRDSHLSLYFILRITTIYQYHSFTQQVLVEHLPVRYCSRCWRFYSEQTNSHPCFHRTYSQVRGDNKSYFSLSPPAHFYILSRRLLFLIFSWKHPEVQLYSNLFHLLLTPFKLLIRRFKYSC